MYKKIIDVTVKNLKINPPNPRAVHELSRFRIALTRRQAIHVVHELGSGQTGPLVWPALITKEAS